MDLILLATTHGWKNLLAYLPIITFSSKPSNQKLGATNNNEITSTWVFVHYFTDLY